MQADGERWATHGSPAAKAAPLPNELHSLGYPAKNVLRGKALAGYLARFA